MAVEYFLLRQCLGGLAPLYFYSTPSFGSKHLPVNLLYKSFDRIIDKHKWSTKGAPNNQLLFALYYIQEQVKYFVDLEENQPFRASKVLRRPGKNLMQEETNLLNCKCTV